LFGIKHWEGDAEEKQSSVTRKRKDAEKNIDARKQAVTVLKRGRMDKRRDK